MFIFNTDLLLETDISLDLLLSAFLMHFLPLLFGIPSHRPLRLFGKPFILQKIFRGRPIPRVKLHNPKNKCLVCITYLPFTQEPKWFQFFRRDYRHNAHNTFLCLLVANLFVRDRERSKPLVMQHQDLDIV